MSFQELQNREIFPDIDSIIQNKDQLFGWRMIDFLREADMIIFIIEFGSKSNVNVISLSQVVKMNSATVKAEEISAITNAIIVNHCYKISSKSLTEKFILKYGNYNHMKWFRAYKQLRDAGIDNETAVGAITCKNYREDRFTTVTSLHSMYELKFKAIDKDCRYYYLVESFDSRDTSALPPYQMGKEIYWENERNTRNEYSKLSPDEILI
ncbi:2790_t:CDS:2 [Cetraspora pellucida]|uniref:2790_t:CDS:1 n=1 Tax=Cetraspora pellucida TaxID=1433469 RepID=A0A9N9NRM2_9GLOM|nr:2790_t:CDS:2 [Cetraspora pellucida]